MASHKTQQLLFLFPLLLSILCIIYISRNNIYRKMVPNRQKKTTLPENERQSRIPYGKDGEREGVNDNKDPAVEAVRNDMASQLMESQKEASSNSQTFNTNPPSKHSSSDKHLIKSDRADKTRLESSAPQRISVVTDPPNLGKLVVEPESVIDNTMNNEETNITHKSDTKQTSPDRATFNAMGTLNRSVLDLPTSRKVFTGRTLIGKGVKQHASISDEPKTQSEVIHEPKLETERSDVNLELDHNTNQSLSMDDMNGTDIQRGLTSDESSSESEVTDEIRSKTKRPEVFIPDEHITLQKSPNISITDKYIKRESASDESNFESEITDEMRSKTEKQDEALLSDENITSQELLSNHITNRDIRLREKHGSIESNKVTSVSGNLNPQQIFPLNTVTTPRTLTSKEEINREKSNKILEVTKQTIPHAVDEPVDSKHASNTGKQTENYEDEKLSKNNKPKFQLHDEQTDNFPRNHSSQRQERKSMKTSCLPSIYNEAFTSRKNTACRPFDSFIDVCKISAKYYNNKKQRKQRFCRKSRPTSLCKLIASTDGLGEEVSCDISICGGKGVVIKTLDSNYGIVRGTKVYKTNKDLQKGVTKAVAYSRYHHFDFIILHCNDTAKARKKSQLLLLPPSIELNESSNEAVEFEGNEQEAVTQQKLSPRPNINVLVLDTLSRNHFLRMLQKTVSEMQILNTGKNMKILDYEMFQSLAPFTFPNVNSFMAGQQDYEDIRTRKIDFSVLFKKLKVEGYQTMMQEDACWYDKWGTVMTSNRKRSKTIEKSREFKKEWSILRKETETQFVDSYGLSHFSCYAIGQYGKSNLFNSGDFCFDGKPVSAHYLDFASEILEKQEATPGAKPQFTYTHLNIAHEMTGKRVRSIDKYLADFVRKIGSLKKTLTVIWSDHGAKTTSYSSKTLAGKFETFDSLLFIAIPGRILQTLGGVARENLLKNQKSLLTAQDLHRSMLFLANWMKTKRLGNKTDNGLFSDKSQRVGCEELPLRGIALCKCANNYEVLNLKDRDRYYDVLWMSEFALGTLNNRLNKEIMNGNTGYQKPRSCKWLQGLGFGEAMRERKMASSRFIFDVVVNHTKKQIFNIHITQNQSKYLYLSDWQRSSIYNPFDVCKDKGASVQLCVCKKKRKYDFEPMLDSGMFGAGNLIHKKSNCLYLIERKHENKVKVYLIANVCRREISIGVVEISGLGWQTSNSLPSQLIVTGLTTNFLTAARRQQDDAPEYIIDVRY